MYKKTIIVFLLFILIIYSYSSPSASIKGHIINRVNRNPVEEAQVEIGGRIYYTDSNGYYEFKNIVIGNLIAKVSHPDFSEYIDLVKIEHGTNSRNFHIEPRPVTVKVRGVVENEDTRIGVANINVSFDNIMAQTDSMGRFYMDGLTPGKYIVRIDHPDYKRLLDEVEITDADINNVKLFLEPFNRYGRVIGEIRNSGGDLIESAQVTIGDKEPANLQGGKFVLEDILMDEHKMIVYADGYKPYEEYIKVEDVTQAKVILTKDARFQMGDNAKEKESATKKDKQDYPEGARGSLEGFVRDAETHEFLPGITLALAGNHTVSDKDGMYYFNNIKPGDYTLNIIAGDYGVFEADIEIKPGTGVFNISLQKSSADALIYGKVIDKKTQRPVIDASVMLSGKRVQTDNRGFYQFKVNKNDYYELKVNIGGTDFYREIIQINSDRQQKDIFLEVK
ncbi:MAG: carboxypeptidase regulatory-like domain-containing protein [Candidatus Muiribacteriota bacterium]